MGKRKTLVCPNSATVEDGVLTLPTSWVGDPFDPYRDFFYFEHTSPFTIKMGNGIAHGNLETYTESDGWIPWIGQGVPATYFRGKYVFPLRGTGNTSISVYNTNIYSFNTINSVQGVRACGNIECLLDFETVGRGEHPAMDAQCFAYLFGKNSKFDITELKLPATELSHSCYQNMCQGCTYSTPIELPATTLTDYCYYGMFEGASIEEAPLLPAEILSDGCYMGMFKNSTLSTAPELPAYTLAASCYKQMFMGCTALTTPPDLTSPYPSDYGYMEMFRDSGVTKTANWNSSANTYLGTSSCEAMYKGCTHLTQAYLPYFDRDSLYTRCFYEMFAGCTALPAIPTTPTFVDYKYESCAYMFRGCSSILWGAPPINQGSPGYRAGDYCFKGMFQDCTSLTIARRTNSGGAETLSFSPAGNYCCQDMYKGCTSLTTPPYLTTSTLSQGCYQGMFRGCTSLVTPPSLPATQLAVGCYESMFQGSGITSAPSLPATTLEEKCYISMFEECASLTTVASIAATVYPYRCCEYMYAHCTALTSAPDMTVDTIGLNACNQMFFDSGLTASPKITANVIHDNGCYAMFYFCSWLTTAGDITATSVGSLCFMNMFHRCHRLQNAPHLDLGTGELQSGTCTAMFKGCTNLETIPEILATGVAGAYISSSFEEMFSGCSKIKISETQTGEYVNAYNVPALRTTQGTTPITTVVDMFANTGGTFTGSPAAGGVYYTSNTIV